MKLQLTLFSGVAVFGLFAACQPQTEHDHGDAGASHVFEGPAVEKAFEEDHVMESPYEFKKVAAMWDASQHTELEVATSSDKENWSEFKPLTITYEEDAGKTIHVGAYTLDGDARYIKLRSGSETPSFMKVEFVEELDAVPAIADAAVDEEITDENIEGVVPRSAWGAKPGKCAGTAHTPKFFTVHHAETPNNDTVTAEARVRGIQNFHQNTRGWCDVGYHYLIAKDGRIFEGNPLLKVGTHAKNKNNNNIGVSYLGNFDQAEPSDVQLNAGAKIIKAVASKYGIKMDSQTIQGHKDRMTPGYTQCPGSKLHKKLGEIIKRANGGSSQPVTVTTVQGVVYEGSDMKKFIAGATVILGGKTVTSDHRGYFKFTGIALGQVTVSASKAGYTAGSVTRKASTAETWASVSLNKAE